MDQTLIKRIMSIDTETKARMLEELIQYGKLSFDVMVAKKNDTEVRRYTIAANITKEPVPLHQANVWTLAEDFGAFIESNPGCKKDAVLEYLRKKGHKVDGEEQVKIGTSVLFDKVSEEFVDAYNGLPPLNLGPFTGNAGLNNVTFTFM